MVLGTGFGGEQLVIRVEARAKERTSLWRLVETLGWLEVRAVLLEWRVMLESCQTIQVTSWERSCAKLTQRLVSLRVASLWGSTV